MKDLHQSGKRLEKAVDSLEKKVKPDYFKDTVELFGRINQAIYGINPYKRL